MVSLKTKKFILITVISISTLLFIQFYLFGTYLHSENHNSEIVEPIMKKNEPFNVKTERLEQPAAGIVEQVMEKNEPISQPRKKKGKSHHKRKKKDEMDIIQSMLESKEDSKVLQPQAVPTKQPIYFLFYCQSLCGDSYEKTLINHIKSSIPTHISQAKDYNVQFVIFSKNKITPSDANFKIVKTNNDSIPTQLNDFIMTIDNQDALIVFFNDISAPSSFDIETTLALLQEGHSIVGSVEIAKDNTIQSAGWNLRQGSCKRSKEKLTSDYVVMIPHLHGYDVSIFNDYELDANGEPLFGRERFEDDMNIVFPSFNGLSLLKETWTSVKGFDQRLTRDFSIDFIMRLFSQDNPYLFHYKNIIRTEKTKPFYSESIFDGGERCQSNDDYSRHVEDLLDQRWFDVLYNMLFERLEVKDVMITYSSPISSHSGYAQEALNLLLPLEGRVLLQLKDQDEYYKDSNGIEAFHYPKHVEKSLLRMKNLKNRAKDFQRVHFSHTIPPKFDCKKSSYCIGRTMFETISLPQGWTNVCNDPKIQEIWVPSKFNHLTFKKAGVDRKKLRVFPEGIDTRLYRPGHRRDTSEFKFLSIFEWTERKGPEILLKAYIDAFKKSDPVGLYIKSYISRKTLNNETIDDGRDGLRKVLDATIKSLNVSLADLPKIELITNVIPFEDMPKLYQQFDAFVLVS